MTLLSKGGGAQSTDQRPEAPMRLLRALARPLKHCRPRFGAHGASRSAPSRARPTVGRPCPRPSHGRAPRPRVLAAGGRPTQWLGANLSRVPISCQRRARRRRRLLSRRGSRSAVPGTGAPLEARSHLSLLVALPDTTTRRPTPFPPPATPTNVLPTVPRSLRPVVYATYGRSLSGAAAVRKLHTAAD